jgi:hypothetical protein
MTNYIYTNSNIFYNKIKKTIEMSEIIQSKSIHKCDKCSFKSNIQYEYTEKNKNKIIFNETDIHLLTEHNIFNFNLYEQISLLKLNYTYEYIILNTNNINIIDGLYEDGSKDKYTELKKNIYNSDNFMYSEHYGVLEYDKNKVSNINIFTDYRIDPEDPTIYLPKITQSLYKYDYVFHTHPKTPYLGSRVKYNLLYEFPSVSDVINFIENHNEGSMIGSLVLAPEGMYIIHKLVFNREIIKLDWELFADELDYHMRECYLDAKKEYEKINYKKLMRNNEIKIPEVYFYNNISINFKYVNRINEFLGKYDLCIDFFPRIRLEKSKNWILPDIYLPLI